MAEGTHILVFRFSAMGDVAMTVPVIKLLLQQHPDLRVTFVSDPFMEPLFDKIPGLQFIGADTKSDYKGLGGLYRLAKELQRSVSYDAIADLHNVLRTKIISLFIRTRKSAAIDKGRSEKKELTRPVNKKLRQLKTSFERYADVFAAVGYKVELPLTGADYDTASSSFSAIDQFIADGSIPTVAAGKKLIGVAPFARHLPKMYPLAQMKQAVDLIASGMDVHVLLFGGKQEAAILQGWEESKVTSVAGRLSFRSELDLIAQLSCMVSMDSANMHLASLYNIPVVSLWGGTHPFLGFYGWGQHMQNALQIDYPCRPSSVFGNKPCPLHGEQGCMEGITPSMIVEKVSLILNKGQV